MEISKMWMFIYLVSSFRILCLESRQVRSILGVVLETSGDGDGFLTGKAGPECEIVKIYCTMKIKEHNK